MRKKYVVDLTDDERATLRDLTKKGTTGARTISRAHILLHAADGATDQAIADALHVGRATVERTRQRFVEGNLDRALHDLPRPGARRKLDGKQEALLVATAGSAAPEPYARWSMRLLADKLVELRVVDSISDETVRRMRKKGA